YDLAAGTAPCACFRFRGTRPSRHARSEVCAVLGSVLPDRELLRGILHPRLHPVHVDPVSGILARCGPAVGGLWRAAPGEFRGKLARNPGRGGDWLFLLPDATPHRKSVVRNRLSHFV